jgi:GTP-binding protein Era
MQSRVERELADDDAVLFVLNGEEGVGAGDRWIAGVSRLRRCRS